MVRNLGRKGHSLMIEYSKFLPFLCMTGMGQPKWNVTRIIEAIIIAGLAAGASTWATQKVILVKVDNLQDTISKVEKQVDRIQRDLYRPIINERH